MARQVTTAWLAKFAKKGTVKFDPEEQTIAQFSELIDKMNQLIEASAERTQADLARSQVQLEVLASLQKTIRQNGTKSQVSPATIDLAPLQEILAQIHAARAVDYDFTIIRREGSLAAIQARAVTPTLN